MENRYLVLTEHRVFSVWKWTALSFEDVGKEKKGECFFCSRVEEILSASEIRRLCSSGSGLQGGALKMSQIAGTVRIISLFAIPGDWLQNLEQAWFKQLGLGGDSESTGVSPVPIKPLTIKPCSHDYVLAEYALNVWIRIKVIGINIFVFQAPLTATDTAILSGNLSTQNGNGGGSINLALRRVTSAKGWGEVGVLAVTHFYIPSISGCLD